MTNIDKIEFTKSLILKQACFRQLAADEIDILASLLVEKRFAPGEIIVSEGEPVDSIYLIQSGTTEVRQIKNDQDHIHNEYVATLKEGDAIGLNETGFYSLSGKRTATVIATSEVVVLKLSVAQFHGFSLAYSHVNEVMREQAKKIVSG